jgi:hypothetical protein
LAVPGAVTRSEPAVIELVWLLLACALSGALGIHLGRVSERRRIAGGKSIPTARDFEAELRRAKGLHRIHPNPQEAGRIHRLRIIRR